MTSVFSLLAILAEPHLMHDLNEKVSALNHSIENASGLMHTDKKDIGHGMPLLS